MLIATFGPTTGWVGKKITRDRDTFVLEGHGVITAQDVMEYDRQGHLVWANDATRVSVAAAADGPRAPSDATPLVKSAPPGGTEAHGMAPTAAQRPTSHATASSIRGATGLEGLTRGDWWAVGGVCIMFGGFILAWFGDQDYFGVERLAWWPLLAAIAALVLVVLSAGVLPERRYDLGGRVPLILVAIGAVTFFIGVVSTVFGVREMFIDTKHMFVAGLVISVIGSAALALGGSLKMRDIAANAPPTLMTKLADLHAKGSLTDEEFASLKVKLTT